MRKEYKYGLIICITLVMILASIVVQSEIPPVAMVVGLDDEQEVISCWQDDDGDYYVFFPGYVNLSQVQIVLRTDRPVYIGEQRLIDGMSCETFRIDVAYTLTYKKWGRIFEHQITFLCSSNIPAMYIDTQSGSMNYIHGKKGNEESGELRLYAANGLLEYAGDIANLNGRGNYSWGAFKKKPYSLKLEEEADLLGMGKAQKWILLANADDYSNMRNKITYDLAGNAGLNYSPQSQWVDLYLNGEYAGLYLLSERNEVHSERVQVPEFGGWLVSMEVESRLQHQNYDYVRTEDAWALRIHYPIDPDEAVREQIAEQFHKICEVASTGEDLKKLINLDSWVWRYLLEEIFMNCDAGAVSQYFYYDPVEQLIYAGPVWDFDHCLGSQAVWQYMHSNTIMAERKIKSENDVWFYGLYKNEQFFSRVTEVFATEAQPLLNRLVDWELDEYATKIEAASRMNQLRWDIRTDVYSEVDNIRDFLSERIQFLSDVWLEKKVYYTISADMGGDGFVANYCIYPGEHFVNIPDLTKLGYDGFLGWFSVDDDEPFSSSTPVTSDVKLYAKWSEDNSINITVLMRVCIGVCFVLTGIGLLVMEIYRNRKKE